MGANLDIYCLTKQREIEAINRFLDEYVDRASSDDRGDEEICMDPLHPSPQGEGNWEPDWEPALMLSHMIQRGLDHPRRSFAVYMDTKNALNMTGALMYFTTDDQLVLGLSISDKGGDLDNDPTDPGSELRAGGILQRLAEQFACYLGWITVEDPPPHSEAEFKEAWKRPRSVYFRAFPSREESTC
jgi:hypothetical protein